MPGIRPGAPSRSLLIVQGLLVQRLAVQFLFVPCWVQCRPAVIGPIRAIFFTFEIFLLDVLPLERAIVASLVDISGLPRSSRSHRTGSDRSGLDGNGADRNGNSR